MLKNLAPILAFGAFAIVVSFLGLVLWKSLFPSEIKDQGSNAEPKQTEEKNSNKQFIVGGDKKSATDEAIAEYTKWLAIFTALLVLISIFQIGFLIRADDTAATAAKAAKDSADVAKETLISTNRAFVFIAIFEVNVLGDKLRIMPQMENSGATPTQEMHTRVAWKFFPAEPPPDYEYPDLDASGNVDTSPETRPAFVGPKATTYTAPLDIPIDRIKAGSDRIFIWGWMEYSDTRKGTPRHRTEFCNELVALNLEPADTNPQAIKAAISFPVYGPHNSAN